MKQKMENETKKQVAILVYHTVVFKQCGYQANRDICSLCSQDPKRSDIALSLIESKCSFKLVS